MGLSKARSCSCFPVTSAPALAAVERYCRVIAFRHRNPVKVPPHGAVRPPAADSACRYLDPWPSSILMQVPVTAAEAGDRK